MLPVFTGTHSVLGQPFASQWLWTAATRPEPDPSITDYPTRGSATPSWPAFESAPLGASPTAPLWPALVGPPPASPHSPHSPHANAIPLLPFLLLLFSEHGDYGDYGD